MRDAKVFERGRNGEEDCWDGEMTGGVVDIGENAG